MVSPSLQDTSILSSMLSEGDLPGNVSGEEMVTERKAHDTGVEIPASPHTRDGT